MSLQSLLEELSSTAPPVDFDPELDAADEATTPRGAGADSDGDNNAGDEAADARQHYVNVG
ncbi:hypothetical protein HKX48_003367, partial [Thoreauomyces humboldtii]